jgi:hypothetical protein
MKIYSKTTSERTAKGVGQGGNAFVRTTLNIGTTKTSRHIATLTANVVGNEVVLQFWAGEPLKELCERVILPLTKGKRQKGKCSHSKTTNVIDKSYRVHEMCNSCGKEV